MRATTSLLLSLAFGLALASPAAAAGSSRKLEQAQTVYSSAMRWSSS